MLDRACLALLKPDIRAIVQKLVLEPQAAGYEQVYVSSPEVDAEEMAFFNSHGISVSGETRPLFRAMKQLADYRGPSIEPPAPSRKSFGLKLPAAALEPGATYKWQVHGTGQARP